MTPQVQTREAVSAKAPVPVLMYHSIADGVEQLPVGQSLAYSVRTSDFNAQLKFVKSTGRSVVSLDQLCNGQLPNSNSVVLTFDDGCETDYTTALPCLTGTSYTATFFLSTANIGTRGYMSWSQVRELHEAGMQLGSHAHEHIPLTPLSSDEAREQLHKSKSLIEDRIGVPVTSMSAPFGFINNRVEAIARDLGFRCICTSVPKMANSGDTTVPRIAIRQTTTQERFEQILNGDWRSYFPAMLRSALAYIPRQILLHVRPSAPGVRELKRPA